MKQTRKAAMHAVERFYQTGKPCKYGHRAPRYTFSGACVECLVTIHRRYDLASRQEFSRLLREKDSLA